MKPAQYLKNNCIKDTQFVVSMLLILKVCPPLRWPKPHNYYNSKVFIFVQFFKNLIADLFQIWHVNVSSSKIDRHHSNVVCECIHVNMISNSQNSNLA